MKASELFTLQTLELVIVWKLLKTHMGEKTEDIVQPSTVDSGSFREYGGSFACDDSDPRIVTSSASVLQYVTF